MDKALRVKIFGSGSIGNHLAHASRQLGWSVDMCDPDPAALQRTRDDIYPSRYGAWDPAIGQFSNSDAPKGGYDLIIVGTPPDHHMSVALAALDEEPRALLVEKPFCTPDLVGADELFTRAAESNVAIFTGYDHVVGEAAQYLANKLRAKGMGNVLTLDVEFREFWGGIFAAHPWLAGPKDTYLGYWNRGGGSLSEHSHAINMWQFLAKSAGAGRVVTVQATLDFVKDSFVSYDRLAQLNLVTETGLMGRVVQDVVTNPSRKWARVQGDEGCGEWHCGYERGQDAVIVDGANREREVSLFAKTRSQDFILELRHIEAVLRGEFAESDISGRAGLETMLVIAAAHKSTVSGKTVRIDYEKGFSNAALD